MTGDREPQMNPPDCNCRYTHCSDAACQSKEISEGAIPESGRMYKGLYRMSDRKPENAPRCTEKGKP